MRTAKSSIVILILAALLNAGAVLGATNTLLNLLTAACFNTNSPEAWQGVDTALDWRKLEAPVNGCAYALCVGHKRGDPRLVYQEKIFLAGGTLYDLTFQYRNTSREKRGTVQLRVQDRKYNGALPPATNWTRRTVEIAISPDSPGDGILEFRPPSDPRAELWLTDVALAPREPIEFLTTAEWTDRLAEDLRPLGWNLEETTNAYVLARGLLRECYRKAEGRLTRQEWQSRCYLGHEVQRLNYHFQCVPLGYYFYVGRILSEAKMRNIPWRDFFEQAFDQLVTNHVSVLLVSNMYWPDEVGETEGPRFVLDLAQRHGIRIILQPTPTYFRPKGSLQETAAGWSNSLAAAATCFAQLDGHPALLAWSFKEEVALKQAAWLAEYYRRLRQLPFHKPVYLLHNLPDAAEYPLDPAPDILAMDGFFFKYVGYLRSPRMSFDTLLERVSKHYQRSLPVGAPFVYVGLTAAWHSHWAPVSADSVLKDFLFRPDPTRGWFEDAQSGWNGCVHYFGPAGGMRGQVWAGLAIGAKGFLGWFYNGPAGRATPLNTNAVPTTYISSIACDRNGREPPQFAELGKTFGEIQPLAPFILNMNRRVIDLAGTPTPETFVTTHAMEGGGETVIAVVNLHIGTIGGKSPARLSPEDKLKIDWNTGQMVGLEPAGPREIEIALTDPRPVFDLKRECDVPLQNGKYRLTLEPGEGTLLLLGDAAMAKAIRERYENGSLGTRQIIVPGGGGHGGQGRPVADAVPPGGSPRENDDDEPGPAGRSGGDADDPAPGLHDGQTAGADGDREGQSGGAGHSTSGPSRIPQ